jgi:hypothetical protein
MPAPTCERPSLHSMNSFTVPQQYWQGPEGVKLTELKQHVRELLAQPETSLSQVSRILGLKKYLQDVSTETETQLEPPHISRKTAKLAFDAWCKLWDFSGRRLSVPDACPGSSAQLLYTWDKGEHHLELEIFPDGKGEFFYRNRISGELWDYEYKAKNPIPAVVFDRLETVFVNTFDY